jgi:DUF2993 family protein
MRVLALVLVVGALGVVMWMGGPGRVTPVLAPPAAADQPTRVSTAPGQQSIQITETELNQELSQQLVGQPLGSTPLGMATLTRISTRLADGHLQADGDARAGSASVPVSLRASGTANDGRAVLLVDEMRAAGVPLPAAARDSVQQSIQRQIDRQVDQMQLRVSSISIGDGKLTLVGSRR